MHMHADVQDHILKRFLEHSLSRDLVQQAFWKRERKYQNFVYTHIGSGAIMHDRGSMRQGTGGKPPSSLNPRDILTTQNQQQTVSEDSGNFPSHSGRLHAILDVTKGKVRY